MGEKITQKEASDKAWEILSALKGEQNGPQQVDPSFTLYLTEIIATRGHTEEPSLSRDMVNDIVAAMMKHGVGMHDWPLIIRHLVTALHTVILYNIPDVYQEKAVELAAVDLKKDFAKTRKEYFDLLGVK